MNKDKVKVGDKFGNLTIIDKIQRSYTMRDNSRTITEDISVCKCDCGNPRYDVNTYKLVSGLVTSCNKCYAYSMIGRRFGELTVVDIFSDNNSKIKVKCKCECGNTITTDIPSLTSGKLLKCGRCSSEYVGKKFGRLTVIVILDNKIGKDKACVVECDCGNRKEMSLSKVINGHITTCGECYHGLPGSYDKVLHDRCILLSKKYQNIVKRCENAYYEDFHNYGGRGIEVVLNRREFVGDDWEF